MKPSAIIFLLPLILLIMSQESFGQSQSPANPGKTGDATKTRGTVLNHVALYVKDLATSAGFYKEIIGLDTMPEPFKDGRHAWFKTGDHSQLHIIQGNDAPPVNHPKNHHTCFSVPSMEVFIALLTQKGIGYENAAGQKNTIHRRPDGVQQVWLRDPDGYWIEINDDKY